MAEVDNKLQRILKTGLNSRVPPRMVNNVNSTIIQGAPSTVLECMTMEVEVLSQESYTNRIITEDLRVEVLNIQDRINSSLLGSRFDSSNKNSGTPKNLGAENRSWERDIVRKGMERLEKEISQYTQVQISKEQVDIALLKKCKTTDIPAVNLAIANIQRALQKYVGFNNIDSLYCDKVGEIMDDAQAWCMNIEEMYNRAEVHSINTSKGDTAEVGIFSDNAKISIFEFLEAAELAYLGWGNITQKANKLYNRNLSEEIKTQLISMSDDYKKMKNWLIENYGSPSRIVADIVGDLLKKSKPSEDNRKQKLVFFSAITGAIQRLERDYLEYVLLMEKNWRLVYYPGVH